MAAILPFLETEQYHFPEEAGRGLNGLGSAVDVQSDAEFLAGSNSELTRLVWTRTLLEKGLAGKTFKLVREGNDIIIQLSEAFDRDFIPWARTSVKIKNVRLFSTNSKMRCPTFDLPAGSGVIGGSCPAAGPAQTVSLMRGATGDEMLTQLGAGKKVLTQYPEVEYNKSKAVCAVCYATGGKYGEPSVQISELVRYGVMKAAGSNPQMRAAIIEALVWQIPRLPFDRNQVGAIKRRDASGVDDDNADSEAVVQAEPKASPEEVRERMKDYPNVVRIHSSGDFFNPDYAKLWVEVARRLYVTHGESIILWAPTRTQVLKQFVNYWKTANVPPNFSIRPSAYHIGDPAPMLFKDDGERAIAAGTSVLTPAQSEAGKGVFFDHQCGVYDLAKGNKTCVEAKNPEGNPGCRACWVRPELRVNYVAH